MKREKTNRLVGAKNRGRAGLPKEKRENEWLVLAQKQWAGRVNLRKIEKTNGLVGAKTGSKWGQAKE